MNTFMLTGDQLTTSIYQRVAHNDRDLSNYTTAPNKKMENI